MTASITYDGVASDEGGNIFRGKSFWVAQRIPMRTAIVDKIRSNGGLIVPLEKNADMLIADHARKDAPRGSYSWKFIEDSVQQGVIQVEDRYQIGWVPNVPRPAGSSRPIKGTRNPYTPAEDALLLQYILAQKGAKAGQKLYMDFAEMYPQHPWQSWRERYVKRLQFLSMEEQMNLAASASALPTTHSPQANTQPSPMQATPAANVASPRGAGREIQASAANQSPAARPIQIDNENIDERAMKDQFYNDLSDFMIAAEMQIDTKQKISDRIIELWDLAQAVLPQNAEPEEIDWLKVAEDLGFNWVEDKECVTQLQECWDANLADFLEAMSTFPQNEESQPRNIDSQPAADSPAIPSSPPARFLSRKRGQDSMDDSALPQKKQRLDKNAEIPSTPEEKRQVVQRTPILQANASSFDITPSQQLRDEFAHSSPASAQTIQNNTASPTASRGVPRRLLHPPASVAQAASRGQRQSNFSRNDNEEEIHRWVEYYEALGYSNKIVVRALKATSMTPGGAAAFVMQSLKDGNGIPSNAQGVWNDRDDEALRLINASNLSKAPTNKQEAQLINRIKRKQKRLLEKHGEAKMELRTRFLAAQEQDSA